MTAPRGTLHDALDQILCKEDFEKVILLLIIEGEPVEIVEVDAEDAAVHVDMLREGFAFDGTDAHVFVLGTRWPRDA